MLEVKAVLFDLDNTLHDRDAAFRRWAERFTAERLGLVSGTPPFTEAVEWLVSRDEGGYGDKPALFAELRRRHGTLREGAEELAVAFHDALVRETRIDAGTRDLLHGLVAAGTPFGIVTNGSARQRGKIEHLGLERLTSCVFISGVFGAKKPDPTIFLAAASHLGVVPGAVLFVGDHPENDIVGAKRVGMKTAWLRRGRSWPGTFADSLPDFRLNAVAELTPLLLGTS
jgi:putative hydrolase of the HAD superfamily